MSEGYDAGVAHRLFTLCSALSLLLCVAVCVVWALGSGAAWRTSLPEGEHQAELMSGYGRLGVLVTRPFHPVPRLRPDAVEGHEFGPFELRYRRLGVSGPAPLQTWSLRVVLPCWLPAILLALPPAHWWTLRQRRQREDRARVRVRSGLCPACGYDLRASSGVGLCRGATGDGRARTDGITSTATKKPGPTAAESIAPARSS
jgi:hypothetical protein